MEHYITEIKIDGLRHLSDIVISLNPVSRQHLLITGKNGSGKTSLLMAVQKYLRAINEGNLRNLKNHYMPGLLSTAERMKKAETESEKLVIERDFLYFQQAVENYKDGIDIQFNEYAEIDDLYRQGDFVTAFSLRTGKPK